MSLNDLVGWIESCAKGNTTVIGICGLPGSGKTTLAHHLSSHFSNRSLVISLDDFCVLSTPERKKYLTRALESQDWIKLSELASPNIPSDNPYADPLTWYDWNAAGKLINDLRQEKCVERNSAWNQKTGLCDKKITYKPPVSSQPLYIVEGIYLFESPLAQTIDKTIMIEIDKAMAAINEKKRDVHRSEDIYLQYKKLVTETYCVPYLQNHKQKIDKFYVSSF